MGDVVLSVPVIKSFLQKYPNTYITLLTKPFFHPFFDGIPNLTLPKVDLKGEHKGVLGLYKLVKELTKTQKFNTVLDLHSVLRTWILGFLFRLKGVPVYKINKGRREKKTFLKNVSTQKLPHSTTRYQQVFERAGFNFELQKQVLTPNITTKLQLLDTTKVNIGLAPFTAHKSKEWGLGNFHKLVQEINKNKKVQFYLFGGGKSEVLALDNLASDYNNVTNLAGKYNLREEMQLIRSLNAMICMDSGNMHIATLLAIPVISVWGGTHPNVGFSALYQPDENSIQPTEEDQKKCDYSVFGTAKPQLEESPYFCIKKIRVQAVINRLFAVLKKENT